MAADYRSLGKRLRSDWKALFLQLLRYPGTAHDVKIDHARLVEHWTRIWRELGMTNMQPARVS
jgi:hypothetical protein